MTTPVDPQRQRRFVPRYSTAAPDAAADERLEVSASQRDPLSILLTHPTLVLGFLAAAFVIYRALQFTDFRIPAAIAVLSTGGLEGVILASIATLLPILAPVASLLAAWALLRSPGVARGGAYWRRIGLWTIAWTGAYIAFGTTPIGTLGALGFLIVIAGSLFRDVMRGIAYPSFAGGFLFSVLAFLSVTSAWLPLERITVGSETYRGYVLEEAAGWTQILRPGGRLVIARSEEVMERAVCDPQLGVLYMTALSATVELFETVGLITPTDPAPPCPQP